MLFLCICKFCSVLEIYLRYCPLQEDFSITSDLRWVALCLFIFYHRTKQNLLYFLTALETSVHVSEFELQNIICHCNCHGLNCLELFTNDSSKHVTSFNLIHGLSDVIVYQLGMPCLYVGGPMTFCISQPLCSIMCGGKVGSGEYYGFLTVYKKSIFLLQRKHEFEILYFLSTWSILHDYFCLATSYSLGVKILLLLTHITSIRSLFYICMSFPMRCLKYFKVLLNFLKSQWNN